MRSVKRKALSVLLFVVCAVLFTFTVSAAAEGIVSTDPNTPLNVRKSASNSSEVINQVLGGTKLKIVGSQPGWYEVDFGSYTGFVVADYVTVIEAVGQVSSAPSSAPAQTPTASAPASTASTQMKYQIMGGEVKTAGSSLNMRATASTSAEVVAKLPSDARVCVFSSEGGWYKAAYGGKTGFVSAEYIELSDIMNVTPGGAKVTTSVLNVRSEPTTNAGIATRLNQNSVVEIIGINSGWFKVKTQSVTGYVHPDYVEVVAFSAQTRSAGTSANEAAADNSSVPSTDSSSDLRSRVVEYAKQFLGVPYKWGGSSPSGFDCSGFVKYVYNHFNISMSRTASSQFSSLSTKVSKSDLRVGDLVFFSSPSNTKAIHHVGIYVGGGSFIHASSPGNDVKYDSILKGYYNTYYMGARDVIKD